MPLKSNIIKIAVICIGDELLKGFTVNTNLSDIGSALICSGFFIDRAVIISDSEDSIRKTMESLLKEGMDVVIMTGGLGPTIDDLTKTAVADALDLDFVFDDKVAEHIKSYWTRHDREIPESVMNQALIPEGAVPFKNEVGTAPGLLIRLNCGKIANFRKETPGLPSVILLPGPPPEMNPMLKNDLIPYLDSLEGFDKTFTETIYVTDLPESNVEKITLPLIEGSGLSIVYCAFL